MVVAGSENCLLFIDFLDPYPMIGIGKIELGKTSSSVGLAGLIIFQLKIKDTCF